jgi:hypothetical protein
MNLRNRKVVITVRTILGLMFLFSGISGLAAGQSMQGVPEPMIPISQALWHSGLFQMIKITEAVAGLMLVVGFLPALALLFLAPICIGIIVFNAVLAPLYVISGLVVSIPTAYLGYAYWDKFKAIFERK